MCSILFVSAARIFVAFVSRLQNNPLFINLGHSHRLITTSHMNSHLQIGFYSTQNVKSLKMGISDKQKLLLLKPWSKLVMHMLVALFLGFMEDVSWNRNGKKNLILLHRCKAMPNSQEPTLFNFSDIHKNLVYFPAGR